jgi:hypothetical protein
MTDIYLASSWRNELQPGVLAKLREKGHAVYDFRNPEDSWTRPDRGDDSGGFRWSEIDPQWESWTPWAYRQALETETARFGYMNDHHAMLRAEVGVLLLPSGRSAHIEAGYFVGHPDKRLYVIVPDELKPLDGWEPELMYKLADGIFGSVDEMLNEVNP